MTRPSRLKFANFKPVPKISSHMGPLRFTVSHSRKFPVLLWRVSRGVKHNQVFSRQSVTTSVLTRRASTRACVRTPHRDEYFQFCSFHDSRSRTVVQGLTRGMATLNRVCERGKTCVPPHDDMYLRWLSTYLLSYWWSRGPFLAVSQLNACMCVSFRES
jgi:hypothetical protein